MNIQFNLLWWMEPDIGLLWGGVIASCPHVVRFVLLLAASIIGLGVVAFCVSFVNSDWQNVLANIVLKNIRKDKTDTVLWDFNEIKTTFTKT